VRTFEVKNGERVFVMKAMSARQFINIQRGDIDEVGLLEQMAESCVEHPFGKTPEEFLDNCDISTALQLLRDWTNAQVETANPLAKDSASPDR
jgi:hypothetical protein